jgi:class 3 adenylate cyclase
MVTGSEARLWELIEARTHTDADIDAIDARIWELFGEEWAVMFTDLVGFSRHTAKFGIIHFLQIIHEQHQLLLPIISDGSGFLVKSEGDSYIVLFRSVRRAIECAIAMQRACQMASARRVDEEKILLCVGIGYGRILRVGEHEVWGTEVNAASRLGEDTALSDQILVTSGAREAAGTMDGIEFQAIDAVAAGSVSNFEVRY